MNWNVIWYAGCPIYCQSKLQTEIALSTAEAEYIALSQAQRETLPMTSLIYEINVIFPLYLPSPRFVIKVRKDNQSNPKFSPQTKHIAIKYHHFSLNNTPTFIRLPHNHSLEMMKDRRDLCHAIRCCVKAKKKSVKRGSKREVFANTTNEYMCVGMQACRAEKGLNCGYHRIKKGFTNEHWDILFKTLKKGEHAFDAYSPTDVIRHVHEAKKTLDTKQ